MQETNTLLNVDIQILIHSFKKKKRFKILNQNIF